MVNILPYNEGKRGGVMKQEYVHTLKQINGA